MSKSAKMVYASQWYDTGTVGYKELIVKKLQENDCRVDQNWDTNNSENG